MPLVKRALSHGQVGVIQWLCCSPCIIPASLLLMIFFQCEKSMNVACGLCSQSDMKDSADSVAKEAIEYRYGEKEPEKLSSLSKDAINRDLSAELR